MLSRMWRRHARVRHAQKYAGIREKNILSDNLVFIVSLLLILLEKVIFAFIWCFLIDFPIIANL